VTYLAVEDILRAEAVEIHGRGPNCELTGKRFYAALNGQNSTALCLSGGGIRSAAFALGVLQALATHPRSSEPSNQPVDSAQNSLLSKFHYLSTVSGGGYIGSWLSAWRLDTPFPEIWKCLVDHSSAASLPIQWLRRFSNYLTPKVGLVSADTWAAIALWIRNLLLNWLVILPPLCAAILAIKLVGVASTRLIKWQDTPKWDGHDPTTFYVQLSLELGSGLIASVALVVALVYIMRSRPTCKERPANGPDQTRFLKGILLSSLLSAFLLMHLIASDFAGYALLECETPPTTLIRWLSVCEDILPPKGLWNSTRGDHGPLFYAAATSAPGAALYALARLIARCKRKGLFEPIAWTISGAVYGALIGLGLYVYLTIPDSGIFGLQVYFLHLVFGVPWVLFSQTFAEMIFTGLTSYEANSDADREWLGRSAGWFVATAMAWMAVSFLVYFGAIIKQIVGLDTETLNRLHDYAPVVAAISGLVTAFIGKSSVLPKTANDATLFSYALNLLLVIAAMTFIVALVIVLSFILDQMIFGDHLMPNDLMDFDWLGRFCALALGLAIAITLSIGSSFAINTNRFSLHALYRNRLIRAFLGASRHRTPDPFTDFDPADNPEMRCLWSPRDATNWRPFHVINIALNVVSSERRLSWQERKAAPFTVSPLHAGSGMVGYRLTSEYGGPQGITLGTAMAISGAAASPNMGYHSSPTIALLMTMFNVRLGWWLGNPGLSGQRSYREVGPAFALKALVQEGLGLTADDKEYDYLSDGGHFENLGLYEMIRRRCRYIVISDAGCDEDYKFQDLGNAVRKVAIDLGVTIHFYGVGKLMRRPENTADIGAGHPYHAIGEIDYRSTDGEGHNGIILYIKAGYHGCENEGIRGYANAKPAFPHESTIDQWFTESQFESYRALGFEITDGILGSALAGSKCATDPTLEGILAVLHRRAREPLLCSAAVTASVEANLAKRKLEEEYAT
jgi:hypothetical protein